MDLRFLSVYSTHYSPCCCCCCCLCHYCFDPHHLFATVTCAPGTSGRSVTPSALSGNPVVQVFNLVFSISMLRYLLEYEYGKWLGYASLGRLWQHKFALPCILSMHAYCISRYHNQQQNCCAQFNISVFTISTQQDNPRFWRLHRPSDWTEEAPRGRCMSYLCQSPHIDPTSWPSMFFIFLITITRGVPSPHDGPDHWAVHRLPARRLRDHLQHSLLVNLPPCQEPWCARHSRRRGGRRPWSSWREAGPRKHHGYALLGGVHQGGPEDLPTRLKERPDVHKRLARRRTLHSERFCKLWISDSRQMSICSGMLINIPLYVIHHNPEYWPEPELFKPERFSSFILSSW